ncbi:MAG: DUF1566 domain-containing protein [Spirochaetes bacterium]|nr:DUF1566 domain-containing protein [Spirochaetota bacterium]
MKHTMEMYGLKIFKYKLKIFNPNQHTPIPKANRKNKIQIIKDKILLMIKSISTLRLSLKLTIAAFGLLIACSEDLGTGEDGYGYEYVPRTYKIGDKGPGGGMIFYHDPDGFIMTDTSERCYYLEAAPKDIPTSLEWALTGHESAQISETEVYIGTGRKNTARILEKIDTFAPAAEACRDYSSGGKNDWFLPSIDELHELYEKKDLVDNLSNGYYWSSSESSPSNAWYQPFSSSSPSTLGKNTKHSVRAIRAF